MLIVRVLYFCSKFDNIKINMRILGVFLIAFLELDKRKIGQIVLLDENIIRPNHIGPMKSMVPQFTNCIEPSPHHYNN